MVVKNEGQRVVTTFSAIQATDLRDIEVKTIERTDRGRMTDKLCPISSSCEASSQVS